MSDPEQIRRRGTQRTLLEREAKRIDDWTKAPPESELSSADVKASRLKLENVARKLSRYNEQISLKTEDGEAYDSEVTESDRFDDMVNKATVQIEELLDRLTVARPQMTTSRGQSGNVRLPLMEIPTFDGKVSEWASFYDCFKSAVDAHSELSKTAKLNYLRSYLRGTALNAVKDLPLCDDNYDLAKKVLQERFGSNELAAQEHLMELIRSAKVDNLDRVDELRKFYDRFNMHVCALRSLKVDPSYYALPLLPILTRLIPGQLVLEYERSKLNVEDDAHADGNNGSAIPREIQQRVKEFEGLLAFIKVEVETREKCRSMTGAKNIVKPAKCDESYKGSKQAFRPGSASLLGAVDAQMCIFCKANHRSHKCNASISVDQRRELARKARACYKCLRTNHMSKDCRDRTVKCEKCAKSHHTIMHVDGSNHDSKTELQNHTKVNCRSANQTPVAPSRDEEAQASTSQQLCANAKPCSKSSVLLQTATVNVKHPSSEALKTTRLLFDSGASRSFIESDLSRSLQLPKLGEEFVSVSTFGRPDPIEKRVNKVGATLVSKTGKHSVDVELLEIDDLSCKIQWKPSESLLENTRRMNLELADFVVSEAEQRDVAVDIIIGGNLYSKFFTGKVRSIDDVKAFETCLGWTLIGSEPCQSAAAKVVSMQASEPSAENQIEDLDAFWRLEHIGIESNCTQVKATNTILRDTNIDRQQDGRYVVGLPWRVDDPSSKLHNNRNVAERQLKSQLAKLNRAGDESMESYHKGINQYIESGHAELVGGDARNAKGVPVYYMPHRGVEREGHETTKLRIVYNASSKAAGHYSLNDLVHPGPNMYPDLALLLVEFRFHVIGITADIEKAFMQVALHESERDAVRFLWVNDPALGVESGTVEYRMTRIPFGVASSPYLLGAVIKQHIGQYTEIHPHTVEKLGHNLYVDDLVTGCETADEARKIKNEAVTILADAKMAMRKWRTNEEQLQSEFDANEGSVRLSPELFSVLGISWDRTADRFRFELSSLLAFLRENSASPTKRNILRTMSRLFDPLGWLSPFVVRVKLLFQDCWRSGIDWDDVLSVDIQQKWHEWKREVFELRDLTLDRRYAPISAKDVAQRELHVFADASERAFATCAYIKTVSKAGEVFVDLAMAKNRIAPLKKVTLPRLELLGAVLAVRLSNFIRSTESVRSKIDVVHYWSDSKIALSWIKGDASRWKPFVANRIGEIQSASSPQNWHYVASKENPADAPTRGISAKCLVGHALWWRGPQSLRDRDPIRSDQESVKLVAAEHEDIREEMRQNEVTVNKSQSDIRAAPFVDLSRFSTRRRAIRVVAAVKRFVHNTRCGNREGRMTGDFSVQELERAEIELIKHSQYDTWRSEIDSVRKNVTVSTKSPLHGYVPFLDENGLLRISSRLSQKCYTRDQVCPIVLSPESRYAELLVLDKHTKLAHAGVNTVVCSLRQQYWIIRARQLTKKVLNRCVTCRKMDSLPRDQVTAPLPVDRIKQAEPFEVVGVDYAGPLLYRTGRSVSKAYILLITCAVTRAVHLELVSDLTTKNFLAAFRRFIGRRGVCKTVYSDNALTFRKADSEIQKLFVTSQSASIQDRMSNEGIVWKFNVPRAPWWGGFFERLVRVVKTALKKTLGNSLLSFEELSTILVEIEATINARPLTYVSSNPQDELALTPATLITGGRSCNLPAGVIQSEIADSSNESLNRRRQHREFLLNHFWRRWTHEYLLQLRSAHKRHGRITDRIADGDVVVIKEQMKPRQCWPVGRIVEAHVGRDQLARSYTIRLPTGKLIKRPVQLLYPLEVME